MLRFLTALLVAVTTPAVGAQDATPFIRSKIPRLEGIERKLQTQTITELAEATETLSTLVTLLGLTGLDMALNDSAGDSTLFAPTNEAFAAENPQALALYTTPPFIRHLTNILLFHVASGTSLASDLSDGMEITMLNDEILTVGINSGSVTLSTITQGVEAEAATANVLATNGVIHLIDGLLSPSLVFRSILDLGGDYTTLVSLIASVGAAPGLENGVLSLFAPNNDAFAALPADTLAFLTSPEGVSSLTTILLYHIVPSVLTSDTLEDGTELITAQGNTLAVSISNGIILVNNATVVEANILSATGVAHGIDSVLIPPSPAPVTIADIVIASNSSSTLVTAVSLAGLVETLANPDATLTVFAPTNDAFEALPAGINDAFEALPAGINDALLTPAFSQHLTSLLLYHVIGAIVPAGDLSDGLVATALNGEDFTVSIDNVGAVTLVDGASVATPVVATDVLAINGVVHIIDGVLLPSFVYRTIIDLTDAYSSVLSLIALADLEDTLRSGVWTFFAPTNAAIATIPAKTVASFLTGAEGMSALVKILTYHVTAAVLTSDKLIDGAIIVTAQGGELSISAVDGTVSVNGIPVVKADILAVNGVTHAISAVLIPSTPSSVPTLAPTTSPTTSNIPTSAPTLPTIVERAVTTPTLSTLAAAVSTAGLVETLADPDATLTVFAPTNDAFAALPGGILTILSTPVFSLHLANVLLYHVLGAEVLVGDLTDGMMVIALNSETLTIGIDGDAVSLISGEGVVTPVLATDIRASNGVVHVIGSVLLPSFMYRTVIDLGASYSTLISLVELAGLAETLKGGPFTLLAPTNDAFGKLPQATTDFLTSLGGMGPLIDILTYHVLGEVITSERLISGGVFFSTLQGGKVAFGVSAATINGVDVVETDLLAMNGVTFGIDTVLTPLLVGNANPTGGTADSAGFAIYGFGTFVFGLMITIFALAL